MVIREIAANEYLVVDQKTLAEAGLTGRLRLIVQPGEIRILPEAEPDPEKTLDELIGCLGQGPAEEYDFNLEIGDRSIYRCSGIRRTILSLVVDSDQRDNKPESVGHSSERSSRRDCSSWQDNREGDGWV